MLRRLALLAETTGTDNGLGAKQSEDKTFITLAFGCGPFRIFCRINDVVDEPCLRADYQVGLGPQF